MENTTVVYTCIPTVNAQYAISNKYIFHFIEYVNFA